MPFALKLITEPSLEPVTLAEAKAHLMTNHDESDSDISAKISESRKDCETECGRAFITQTWKLFLDEFPKGLKPINLPLPPVQSVTWVKYYDADGTLQTLDAAEYHTALEGDPPRIVTVNGWPATETRRPQAVEVQFVCGYGTAANVPSDIKAAIKLVLGHRFRHRGDEDPAISATMPIAAKRILFNYRAVDATGEN